MSTTKISDLPVLSTADAADEFVVVDDSAGVTKKITQAGLADFGTNAVTTGTLTASGLVTASAGINFGADTLDDYEEGTWTPKAGDGSSLTVNAVNWYIKIGNLVHCAADVTLPNPNPGSSSTVTGLPFLSRSGGYGSIGFNDANQSLSVRIDDGIKDDVSFDDMDASGSSFNMSGVRVQFSITYTTSSL